MQNQSHWLITFDTQWAISELLFVSVSKWVLVLNYCKGNEFDLRIKNAQLISIWMVVRQDSLWNWGMQQLGNGLLKTALNCPGRCEEHFPLSTGFFIECFHMTSQRPCWCSKTKEWRPWWCTKLILRELNSILMQILSFVSVIQYGCWSREWKRFIECFHSRDQ